MKKQVTILILFLFTSTFAWSRSKYIKTRAPCDNALVKKASGRWMPISKRVGIGNEKPPQVAAMIDK